MVNALIFQNQVLPLVTQLHLRCTTTVNNLTQKPTKNAFFDQIHIMLKFNDASYHKVTKNGKNLFLLCKFLLV